MIAFEREEAVKEIANQKKQSDARASALAKESDEQKQKIQELEEKVAKMALLEQRYENWDFLVTGGLNYIVMCAYSWRRALHENIEAIRTQRELQQERDATIAELQAAKSELVGALEAARLHAESQECRINTLQAELDCNAKGLRAKIISVSGFISP